MTRINFVSPFISFLFVFFILVAVSCRHNTNSHWDIPEKEIQSLNNSINHASVYALEAEKKADSLKSLLRKPGISPSERQDLFVAIARHYRPRMADSALYYSLKSYDLAHKIGNPDHIFQSSMMMTDALSASGLFTAATHYFDSINPNTLNHDDKITYWKTGRKLYSNLCNYVGEGTLFYDNYKHQYAAFDDSLINNLPETSLQRLFVSCERLIDNGKANEARVKLEKILNNTTKNDNLYGMTAYQLAKAYKGEDQTKYAALLAEAAESDVVAGVRDGYALPELAGWLYKEGHFNEAFRYINFALDNAYTGNARMRLVNISQWVPEIDEAYRKKSTDIRNDFATIAIIVSILFLLLIVFMIFMVRELKKRRKAHTAAASASKLKDRYIRDFIGLCSAYSEKYDSLTKTVTRKITSGQAQELLKIVKYGKASENDNEEFYQTIDSVFLGLYPDFIERINALLLPDQQFNSEETPDGLTPELRIYGFVRLGVNESAKIARILNYSVNTVYAYRNRMRNRAINRDTFDEDVKNLLPIPE